MKILSLEVSGLHGYISHKINFNDDLTILVGINGSGKTSIFHLINDILQFNLPRLCITKLENAILKFNWNNELHIITLTQDTSKLWIDLEVGSKKYHPIFADFREGFDRLAKNPLLNEELLTKYSRLNPEDVEIKAWQYLKNLKKPTFVSLDRKVLSLTEEGNSVRLSNQRTFNDNVENNDPIVKSINASKKVWMKYRNELDQLNAELIKTIALSFFDDEYIFSKKFRNKIISESDLNDLETKVLSHSSFLKANDRENRARIQNHFKNTKKLMMSFTDNTDASWEGFLRQRLDIIQKIIKAFDNYDKTVLNIGLPIQNYLNAINKFLSDTNKNLFFLEEDNGLYFESLDDEDHYKRDVRTLSSGEKQLFILLSHLAFISEDSGLLMIDEPEISLHPSWQKKFIETIDSLRPTGCQVLLATHSPEIASPRRDRTRVI
jgi:predicted ATPase